MSNNPCLLLLFCSDSCRARFLAERNTKPVNVAKAPPAVAQSSSPPLSSENVQIHSGILNPQCYQTSPASMEQALWLSRATALLRVEEERRKHEHLKQTLLKYAPQVHSVWKSSKKVSFNISSEACYVYILSGQKLIKNDKNGPIWWGFDYLKLVVKQCYQTGQF